MAYAKIYFEHPQTGRIREAPVGFSWTVLFFSALPPLFRAHWLGFVILLLCALLTSGLSGLVFMFIYNKMYIKHLIGDGYKARSASSDLDYLQQRLNLPIPRLELP
ncbi:MAG: hypothetical protein ACXIU7_08375 [Roseinatronobacter sp.]